MYTITWETTSTSGATKGCTLDHKVRNVDPAIAADFIRVIREKDATVRAVTVYQSSDGAVVPLASIWSMRETLGPCVIEINGDGAYRVSRTDGGSIDGFGVVHTCFLESAREACARASRRARYA